MTTSRVVLPDGNGRTVAGRPAAHVGQKLSGSEFRQLGQSDIKGWVVNKIYYSSTRDHFTFIVS